MGYDLSIQAASIEDAISSTGYAMEMLEGCECEDEIDILSEVLVMLLQKHEKVTAQISREAQETRDELTRRYYRER